MDYAALHLYGIKSARTSEYASEFQEIEAAPEDASDNSSRDEIADAHFERLRTARTHQREREMRKEGHGYELDHLRLQTSSDEEREFTKNSDIHEQLAAGLSHSAEEVRRWGSSSLQSLLESDDDQDGDDKETLPECSIHSQLRLGSKEEEIFQYSFDNMLRTARRCERLQQDQLASPKTYSDVLLNYDETKCATCPFPCTSTHDSR